MRDLYGKIRAAIQESSDVFLTDYLTDLIDGLASAVEDAEREEAALAASEEEAR